MAWPVVDFVATGLEGVRTLYAVSQPSLAYVGKPYSKTGDIALGVSSLTLFLASGLVGSMRVNECQEAIAAEADPDSARDIAEHARQIRRQRRLWEQQQQQPAVQSPPPGASPGDAWGSPSSSAPSPAPRPAPAPAARPPEPSALPQARDPE
jgi:hypothetical protein